VIGVSIAATYLFLGAKSLRHQKVELLRRIVELIYFFTMR